MTSFQDITQNLMHVCKEHSKAKDILKKVNGKRDYKEIARILKIHPTKCSDILSKAKTFDLLIKVNGFYKKSPEFKHINIDRTLKNEPLVLPEEKKLRIKKRKKIVNTVDIKKKITDYIHYNFKSIPHPFTPKKQQMKDSDLKNATEKLFEYVEKNIEVAQIDGLADRFFESFTTFFSVDRVRKAELINAFSNMVKCFEPYVKKVASIKTNNPDNAKRSLDKALISLVVSFNSDIKNHKPDYWKDKPIHEASIRVVYPFRHMEAHESRDYTGFEVERVFYYMFASIVFINLNY